MWVNILAAIVHVPWIKGFKTAAGVLLDYATPLVPPQYQPILHGIAAVTKIWGVTSIALDKSGILPANQFKE